MTLSGFIYLFSFFTLLYKNVKIQHRLFHTVGVLELVANKLIGVLIPFVRPKLEK